MKIIEITISPTGQTKLETRGFVGSECQKTSAHLEQALGVRSAETLKSEFYEQSPLSEVEQQSQR
jgi:hypothetical protein